MGHPTRSPLHRPHRIQTRRRGKHSAPDQTTGQRGDPRQRTPTLRTHKPTTDMELQTEIQKNIAGPSAGAITVKLAGSLDTATAPELENQLKPVLAGPVHDLIFDLAGLKFISSAGLRVFAASRK